MGLHHRGLVLLAEDEIDQRQLLEDVLEGEGYRVLMADNPSRVLQELLRGPDAVLLDLVGVTSPAVMRVLRALPNRPGLMLVSADDALPKIAELVGADAYLPKPYELERLLAGLERLMRRRRGEAGAAPAEMGWANALG
jgi:DNA-binding response OmpR family regulator